MNEKKILFFDDEVLPSENLIRNLVTNYGHQITCVSTVADFMEELTKEKYSLLIIDVMAPITSNIETLGFTNKESESIKKQEGLITGIVLAERVWRESGYENIPIIFFTAKAPFKLNYKENRKIRILQKPVLAKNFSKEINELIEE